MDTNYYEYAEEIAALTLPERISRGQITFFALVEGLNSMGLTSQGAEHIALALFRTACSADLPTNETETELFNSLFAEALPPDRFAILCEGGDEPIFLGNVVKMVRNMPENTRDAATCLLTIILCCDGPLTEKEKLFLERFIG